jgi:hypothetical protein
MRFLRKLLGETDALEEATREAGGDIRGDQVEAPEAPTLPEEAPELPEGEQGEPSTHGG